MYGLAQSELAVLIGATDKTVGDWEGHRTKPKHFIRQLSELFEVSPDVIRGEEDVPPWSWSLQSRINRKLAALLEIEVQQLEREVLRRDSAVDPS